MPQVTFGANIKPLVEGIARVKEAVGGVGESVDSLGEKLNRIGELIGVAFSVEGVKRFVEGMAELGEKMTLTAATLGVTNQQVVALSGYAALGGQSIDELATGLERMSLNIQRSTRDGVNPQAQALRVLGLNARDLIGVPADQYFIRLADAVARFNPSLNLTNALMEVGGRQATALLPILLQGGEHMREFQQAWTQASDGLAAAIPGMDETHEKLLLLDQSATSFGARVFSVLKPAIDGAITAITRWLQSMDTAKITRFAEGALSALQTATTDIAAFFIGAGTSVDDFVNKLETALNGLKKIGEFVAGGSLGLGGLMVGGPLGMGSMVAGGIARAMSGTTEAADNAASKTEAAKGTVVAKINDFFAAIRTAIASGNASLGDAKLGGGLNAGAINMGAADAMAAKIRQVTAEVQRLNQAYQQQAGIDESLARTFQITEEQKTAMLLQAVDFRITAQKALLEAALQDGRLTRAQATALEAELNKIKQQGANDRMKIEEEAAQQAAQAWRSFLEPIEAAWDSQLRGLLAGTESFATAMKKMAGDLVMEMIKEFEKLAVIKPLENLLSGQGGGVGGPGTLLGLLGGGGPAQGQQLGLLGSVATGIGKLFSAGTPAATAGVPAVAGPPLNLLSQGAGGAANTLAQTTLTTAGTTLTTAGGALNIAATALSTAAATLTGAAGAETAAAGAQTASATTSAALSLVPHDVGNWNVRAATPALLHPGEMVISEPFASGLRGALGRGGGASGGDMHFNFGDVHAHAAPGQQMDGATLMRSVLSEIKNNPSVMRSVFRNVNGYRM